MSDSLNNERLGSEKLYDAVKLGNVAGNIRVIDLLPGRLNDDIRIHLRVINLPSDREYEALSYTWGKSTQNRSLYVNGRYKLALTDNLFNALRRLRKRWRTRTLWIDQICINQGSNVERNHQVAQMARIYSDATLVNVWLGEPQCKVSRYPLHCSKFRHGVLWRSLVKLCMVGKLDAVQAFLFALRTDQMVLGDALSCYPAWYYRAWVVQEFVLAREIYFWYGSQHWRHTSACMEMISQMVAIVDDAAMDPTGQFETRLRGMMEWRGHFDDRFGGMGCPDIYDNLRTGFRAKPEATKPEDYVYSMLGLICKEEAVVIGCDYDIPCSRVYARATFASIKERKDFDIFSAINLSSGPITLPTWAVDFQRCDIMSPMELQTDPAELESDYMNPSPSVECTLDATDSKLHIHGGFMDIVVRIIDCPDPRYITSIAQTKALSDLNECFLSVIHGMLASDSCSPLTLLMRENELFLAEGCVNLPSEQECTFPTFTPSSSSDSHASNMHLLASWMALATAARLIGPERWQRKQMLNYLPSDGNRRYIPGVQNYSSLSGTHATQLFLTSGGAIGIAPLNVRIGDKVVLIRSHRPFIALREQGQEHTFQGPLYIFGFEREEVFRPYNRLGLEDDMFDLI